MNEVGVGRLLVLLGVPLILGGVLLLQKWRRREEKPDPKVARERRRRRLAWIMPVVFLLGPLSDTSPVRWLDEFFRTPLPPEQAGLVVQAGQRALSDGRVAYDRSDRDGYVLYLRNDSDWIVTSVWGTIEFEFEGLPPRSVSGLLPMYVQSSRHNVSWPQSDFSLIELDLDLGEDPIAQTLTVESVRGYRR
ncbi:MAG: hypothetical protein JJ896_11560 [Rhodothermales bacterium]|nr:hypothetical protein [Rhodothermales bacterium]MBO6780280.1 hypothetical protein [Rhodothermales bacterium]